jgi:MFS family permease
MPRSGPESSTRRRPGESVSLRAAAIVCVVILLAVLSQFYRSSLGVIAPNLMHELGLSADDVGLASGSFFLIFAALQIPIGVLLDRFGTRRVVASLLLLAVAGSLQFARAESLNGLIAGRLLIGLGFSGLMIGAMIVLRRWFPADRFATVLSIVFASSNAGSLAATWPLAASATAWGWRATFLGLTALTAALTIGFFAVMRDAPPDQPRATTAPPSLAELAAGLRRLLAIRDLPLLLPIVAVGYGTVASVLGLWGGPYLHDLYGLGSEERGLVLSIMAMSMIAGTIAFGPLDRYVGSRKRVVAAGALGTAALVFLLALDPRPSLLQAGAILSGFCFVGAYSVTSMAHGMALFSDELAGRGAATLTPALMGGAALIQVLSGQLAEFAAAADGHPTEASYVAVFAFIGAVTLAALLVYGRAADARPGSAVAPEPPPRGRHA